MTPDVAPEAVRAPRVERGPYRKGVQRRQEIVRAAQALAEQVRSGALDPAHIDVDRFEQALDTFGIPDPDLVIRTSGEQRTSNFLTWQTAYSEFVFIPDFWPDFDHTTLAAAIDEYRRRDRRFGGLSARAG